jgi:hypothetical protein
MDPITAIFTSYLDIVSTSLTDRTSDILGTEMQARIVEHDSIRVPYTYQMWQIRKPSVCESYRDNFSDYSKCTIAAKSLFNDICTYLQDHPGKNWKYRKHKNMYCHAAISYKPTMAAIDWTGQDTELEDARSECNVAKAGHTGNPDPQAQRQIKQACRKYNSLKSR